MGCVTVFVLVVVTRGSPLYVWVLAVHVVLVCGYEVNESPSFR